MSVLSRNATIMHWRHTCGGSSIHRPLRGGRRMLLAGLGALVLLATAASMAVAGPAWRVDPLATTTAAPGDPLKYLVQLTNKGDAAADATVSPITFTGTLPAGLTVVSVDNASFNAWDCSSVVSGAASFRCTDSSDVFGPTATTTFNVNLAVDPAASGLLTSTFAVTGGDPSSPSASAVDSTRITSELPSFGVDAFDGVLTSDANGTPLTQAGGHPFDASTSFDINTVPNPLPIQGPPWPREPVKDVFVDLPPGFIGNPTGVSQCTLAQISQAEGIQPKSLCPPSSQIGVALVHANVANSGTTLGPIPVFNMVPPSDAPARFGFNAAGTVVTLDAKLRSATDYGITVETLNIPEGIALTGTTLTLWGVPSDPVHDLERACPGERAPWDLGGPTCASGAPRTAFLRNPTSCPSPGVGLPTVLRADSWEHPGVFSTASFISHLPLGYPFPPSDWGPQQGPEGCARVPFAPRLEATPITTAAAEPSAFTFDVSLPQNDDPRAIGESDLRRAVVTLPPGVRVNPSSAAGLAGCAPAQIGLDTAEDPRCPDGSKLGTVTIDTPLLPDPVLGSIYLATPHDNPFGTLIAVYLVARGPGVIIKLPGRVEADPSTGQLTSTFDDNPQLPFSNLHLAFKGGPRSPLVTPRQCGAHTTRSVLTGWSGRTVETTSVFSVSGDGAGAPCSPPRFKPTLDAGTESNSAGSSSSFLLRFTREDADQELKALSVSLPSGLTGKIASADLCSDAAARAGSCGPMSKIGDVTVGAGAGSNPFYITSGRAYLTGPYKGAPFGIAIVVPAIAGPFDLGNVTVRSALFVDKHTAEVRVVSDPLPTILQGIPLDVRDVRVNVNKPGFFLNPTSCAEKAITAQFESTEGARASASARFQAADCRGLSFRPRMSIAVGGRGHTRRNQTTPFSTTVRMPRGDANLRFVRVTLPRTINARLTVINDACTRREFEANINNCRHAQAGSASASTPLLRDPLKGAVYFVKNGHPLPDLFVALRGQVAFDLIGRITIPGSTRLRTTFATAPDVPIRSFSLRLFGDAKNGSVGAAANLCSASSRRQKVELDYIAQSGKVLQTAQRLDVRGCGRSAGSAKTRRQHGRR